MTGEPLTDAEVRELDSFGRLSGRASMPARAAELWEREILYGRMTPDPRSPANGLIAIANSAK